MYQTFNSIKNRTDIRIVAVLMIGDHDIIERIKLCDQYVNNFEKCISNKNSTAEDIHKSFFILVSCEIKHGLYLQK